MQTAATLLVGLLVFPSAVVSGADVLSSEEASSGLKQVLNQSAGAAVDRLGVTNGFLENPKVKIGLPVALQKAEAVMRTFGMNKPVDNLIVSMNRAAEASAAGAKPLLLDAVQKMAVDDAQKIIMGGDDAATQYFRNATSEALEQKFLPIVKNATDQAGVLKKYNEFAGKGAKVGLIAEKDANIENYITKKTLDGLYLVMAEEERAIRSNPVGFTKELQDVLRTMKQTP